MLLERWMGTGKDCWDERPGMIDDQTGRKKWRRAANVMTRMLMESPVVWSASEKRIEVV